MKDPFFHYCWYCILLQVSYQHVFGYSNQDNVYPATTHAFDMSRSSSSRCRSKVNAMAFVASSTLKSTSSSLSRLKPLFFGYSSSNHGHGECTPSFPARHRLGLGRQCTLKTFAKKRSKKTNIDDNLSIEKSDTTKDGDLETKMNDSSLTNNHTNQNDDLDTINAKEDNLRSDDSNDSIGPDLSNNVNIPKTGVSLGDEIMESQATQFVTEFEPWIRSPGLAKITTLPPFQPTRYIVPLYAADALYTHHQEFVMVDIPPFSQKLLQQILNHMVDITAGQSFTPLHSTANATTAASASSTTTPQSDQQQYQQHQQPKGKLVAILITSRDGIHYDQSPAVYVTRKSDLQKWKDAFPGIPVIMYRLDVPRDCNSLITQKLDGYGPWAWGNHTHQDTFIETGRPLTRIEWNETIKIKVLDQGDIPPDDLEEDEEQKQQQAIQNEHLKDDSTGTTTPINIIIHADNRNPKDDYTPEAIRKRELKKYILAIYTPGHTFGSVTYVFPDSNICCSGYTLPCEDTRMNEIGAGTGPILDYRGYLSTNKGNIQRQVESSKYLIETYSDRFHTILPSIGRALFLQEKSVEQRKELLVDALDEWKELGKIYQDFGIL